jgi:hypothetical protein
MKKLVELLSGVALLLAIAACGGGSSSNQPNIQAPGSGEPATVAILLTDASADDYDHAYATITSIELLGGGGGELIFSGEQTVDLLALRDTVQLFAVNEDVEPGDYEKIRLTASSLMLVVDGEDGPLSETQVDLVANGKIDLNPRGTFSIDSGGVVFISLDWDVNESLKLTETGSSKTIMRPVVFVDIGFEPVFKRGLVRVHGTVEAIAPDLSYFRLCSLGDATQLVDASVLNALCIDVVANDNTGFFGDDGQPVLLGDLMAGDPLTVLGLMRRGVDGPELAPLEDESGEMPLTQFQVLAIVVEGGERGTWFKHRGTLESAVDPVSNTFDFLSQASDGTLVDTAYTAQLFDESRIFSVSRQDGVTEITPAGLMALDVARLDAVQVPADDPADPDLLRVAIMLARTPSADVPVAARGEILSIDLDTDSLRIATPTLDRCVTTDAETRIFEVFVTDVAVETMSAALAELTIGSGAFVTGVDAVDGCIAADLIVAEGQTEAPL